MQNITNNNKRVMNKSQRPRKKPLPHHSKMPSQINEGGDRGTNYNPSTSYYIVRYLVGNRVNVYTSSHVSTGILTCLSPSNDVCLSHVHTAAIGSEDGPFTTEKCKYIPLSDVKTLVAMNVKTLDSIKDNAPAEDSSRVNDSDAELQKFYDSPVEGDACSLESEEGFPVDQMFKINKEKYNVVSTYKEDLEGYTCPLDKSDPDFKKKEQYYAKIAKEMEEDKNLASHWEAMAEGDVESEEVRFSAVLRDGVPGREYKNSYARNNRGNKGGRGNARASLPRETTESTKPSVRPNAFTLPREQTKTITENSSSSKSEKPTPKASRVTTPALAETPEKAEVEDKGDNKSSPTKIKFDPDAPVFEPSRSISTESPVPNAVSGSAQPPAPASNLTMAHPQQALPNGVSSTLAFSPLPYPNPGLLSFPYRPPQQLTYLNQIQILNAGNQNQRAMRPNAPVGYSKQRSLDPATNPYQNFAYTCPITFPFIPAGNVSLINPATGQFHIPPNVQQSSVSQSSAASAAQTVQSPPPQAQSGSMQFQTFFSQSQNPPYPQYPNTAAAPPPVSFYPQPIPGYQPVYHPQAPHGQGNQPALIPTSMQIQPNAAAAAASQQAYQYHAAAAAMAAAIGQQQQQGAPANPQFMQQNLQQLQYLAQQHQQQQQQANNPG